MFDCLMVVLRALRENLLDYHITLVPEIQDDTFTYSSPVAFIECTQPMVHKFYLVLFNDYEAVEYLGLTYIEHFAGGLIEGGTVTDLHDTLQLLKKNGVPLRSAEMQGMFSTMHSSFIRISETLDVLESLITESGDMENLVLDDTYGSLYSRITSARELSYSIQKPLLVFTMRYRVDTRWPDMPRSFHLRAVFFYEDDNLYVTLEAEDVAHTYAIQLDCAISGDYRNFIHRHVKPFLVNIWSDYHAVYKK